MTGRDETSEARQRKGVVITVVVLAAMALVLFLSAFFLVAR